MSVTIFVSGERQNAPMPTLLETDVSDFLDPEELALMPSLFADLDALSEEVMSAAIVIPVWEDDFEDSCEVCLNQCTCPPGAHDECDPDCTAPACLDWLAENGSQSA